MYVYEGFMLPDGFRSGKKSYQGTKMPVSTRFSAFAYAKNFNIAPCLKGLSTPV